MISPTALNMFSPSPASSEDVGSTSLFPSLDPGLSTSGMTSEEVDEQGEHDTSEYADTSDSATAELMAKTLLEASEGVLLENGGKLHVKDIADGIVESGLISARSKALNSLESILYRETFREGSRFKRIENHFGWFALMEVNVDDDDDEDDDDEEEDDEDDEQSMDNESMEGEVQVTGEKMNISSGKLEHDYKRKYIGLKKIIKQLVFENGALCDEISHSEAKLQRAKFERKFLLKRLFQYQAATEAGVFQVPTYPPFPPEVLQPMMLPLFPAEKAKAPKIKAKKTLPKPKAEKVEAKSKAKNPKTTPDSSGATKEGVKKEGAKARPVKQEKKRAPKPKKTKVETESPQPSISAAPKAATTGTNATTPPSKPKRKKPGTAVKRKVQPIAVDAKGKPIFPIVLGGLTVHSLGEIVHDRPGFHSERYIWPVGYCSSRVYPSMRNPEKKCIYTCKILDGGFGPQFEMCPEDDPDHPIIAASATACHCVVLKAVNKARGRDASNTGSGPEFFGFSHPTIQYLLQSLPGARKCTKYQWVKFELPKPQTKPTERKLSGSSAAGSPGVAQGIPTDPDSIAGLDEVEDMGRGMSVDDSGRSLAFHSSSPMEPDEEIFKDHDMSSSIGPLTLASTITPLSSPGLRSLSPSAQLDSLEQVGEMDAGMNSLMSSPSRPSFPATLASMALSPTAGSQSSFVLPPTSPLFGNSSGFPGTGLPESPK